MWTRLDRYLFHEGTHARLYRHLGAHKVRVGWRFAVWAPHALRVGVIGDFNGWQPDWLEPKRGLWQGTLTGPRKGQRYKFRIETPDGFVDKADPFATLSECPPATASVLWSPTHTWEDDGWERGFHGEQPMSIYEMHLGSWRKGLSYGELAQPLIEHVQRFGFTHVELLPVMEHPFYGSWGYQVTGYFAPSARYGTPDDLMALIDALHQAGIGVLLDWVPAHFPRDAHALYRFDGTPLYEHADPRRGHHPDWDTAIFDYGRPEVRSFLLSSALYWLDVFHADGLRVDAVASMLYLDYSRGDGEWEPNEHGGHEHLEAIELLQALNRRVDEDEPGAIVIAEESTAWPGVTHADGLGFDAKWDLGWMHDTLELLSKDPIYRRHHHDKLTFRSMYAFTEGFVLPLSHDEVVHGKGSLWGKMPGDEWQKRANYRLLLALQWLSPGKKLLFMGGEWGHRAEWSHDAGLDWTDRDAQIEALVQALNALYRQRPALHAGDWDPSGWEWIAGDDAENGVIVFLRHGGGDTVLVVVHVTPEARLGYRVGVPSAGPWRTVLNTDDARFGGTGAGEMEVEVEDVPWHGRVMSVSLDLPPLGVLVLDVP